MKKIVFYLLLIALFSVAAGCQPEVVEVDEAELFALTEYVEEMHKTELLIFDYSRTIIIKMLAFVVIAIFFSIIIS